MTFINRATEILSNWIITPFIYPFQRNVVEVKQGGLSARYHFRPWTADKFVIWEVWSFDEYTNGFLTISANDTVVDIGAQIGVFTVYASKLASQGRVLAFEPHPDNFSLLKENIQLNKCINIVPFEMAVGKNDATATTPLFIHPNNSGGHSVVAKVSRSSVAVSQISLAKIISQNNLSKVNFLKIDTEGSEFNILLSTPIECLKKVDQISLEYHDYLSPIVKHTEIARFLTACDFDVKIINYPVISRLYRLGSIQARRR